MVPRPIRRSCVSKVFGNLAIQFIHVRLIQAAAHGIETASKTIALQVLDRFLATHIIYKRIFKLGEYGPGNEMSFTIWPKRSPDASSRIYGTAMR